MKRNNSSFRYKNIFLQSSLQFLGYTLEYFIQHTEKLVVFIIMPRVGNAGNVVRVYRKGKLVTEAPFVLSKNIFLYYIGWYIHYLKTLNTYYIRQESFFAIVFHPIFFFGMTIQKLWRKITFVYWVADYFPENNQIIIWFEKLKKLYHRKMEYSLYASDTLNKIMNRRVLDSNNRKTVMLGVRPKKIKRMLNKDSFNILFIGLIKESQGLDFLFRFLKENKGYYVKILGVCEKNLYAKYMALIKSYSLDTRVYFPNRFFSDDELDILSSDCQIGIALYDPDPSNVTYYTDPGKVKAYTTLGLPVVMSNMPSIAPYIVKFRAGEIVGRSEDLLKHALKKIKTNYKDYTDGVEKFNKYFYFEDYYRKKFSFLERM